MKVRTIGWLFVALLALLVILQVVFPSPTGTTGVSAEWCNGEYRFAGGTNPAGLCASILFLGLYCWVLNTKPVISATPLRGLSRRFVATWLDLVIAMLSIAPLFGLPTVLIEWARTRRFQWYFERTTPMAGDSVLAWITVLGGFIALALYFAVPIVRRRPSPGGCVLGYQVVPCTKAPLTLKRALLRSVVGFVALCTAYLLPFVGRDERKGQIWVDKVFGTRAELL